QQSVTFSDLWGPGNAVANAVAIDAAGRIVVAGSADHNGGTDIVVSRLTSTGWLDTSYGGGTGRSDLGNFPDGLGGNSATANAVAIDPQDRIVVAGSATTSSGGSNIVVARLNANGYFDRAYGGGYGWSNLGNFHDLLGGYTASGSAVAIDPQGR